MQEKVNRSKRRWVGPVIMCLVLGLFILIPLWGYHVIQSGFDNLTTWETGCAVESSITQFYQKHDRFLENWEEINTSYLENGYDKAGYGFPVEQLPEYIDVNFEFLRRCNRGERGQAIAEEQTPWIIAAAGWRNRKHEKNFEDFYGRIMFACRENDDESIHENL